MKTVFITGASGMIGMELTNYLLSKGYKIVGTDRQSNEFIGRPNYTFIQATIADKQRITSAINSHKIDAVVALANSVDNDIPTVVTDQEMDDSKACDKYFWKACVSAGIKDILMLSTTQVYAPTKSREPIREEAPLKPTSNYAKLKYDSECALKAATKKSDSIPVIMRVAPIYKPGYTQNLRDKVYDNKDDVGFVYGDGSYGFSCCCLYNLIEFINAILSGPQGHYDGEFNICDTRLTLAKEIIEYERAGHRIGVVLQRSGGAEAIKAAIGVNAKKAKYDYRYVDLSNLTNNTLYDNTKAKRFSTFRWNLTNMK